MERGAGLKWRAFLLALLVAWPVHAEGGENDMLIIAHRGASGERPEHTLAAYERAINQGADYIEPDLVATKDGVLVARHENEISGTTDVGERPEFTDRFTTREIDGEEITGWFTEDFSLAELRTLRARERLPELRPANARFDGLYQLPTLAEIVALVRGKEAETGRRIGIYPEIKHPGYFRTIGLALEPLLVEQLHAAGYRSAGDPVFIQSFEPGPLAMLDGLTDLRLIQLVAAQGGPADRPNLSYADMLMPARLAKITEHAEGIGVDLALLLDEDGAPTGLVEAAHDAGLAVHGWTLRKENAFLPPAMRVGSDPAAAGRFDLMWEALRSAGIDGLFTDDPGLVPKRVEA